MTVHVDMNDPRLQGPGAPVNGAQPHGRSRDNDDPSSPYSEGLPRSDQEKRDTGSGVGAGYMHESPGSDVSRCAKRPETCEDREARERDDPMARETAPDGRRSDNTTEQRVEKLADGSVFEGQFRGRDRHGWGKFTWSTGGSYSGQFDSNDMHGEGTYQWSDGSSYAGQWQRNNMGPKGVMEWTDGRKYEGQFRNGKKHGEGQLLWPDGRSYTGQWEAGKQHGTGVTVTGKGVSRKSLWEHGKLLRWLEDRVEPDTGGAPTNRGVGAPLGASDNNTRDNNELTLSNEVE